MCQEIEINIDSLGTSGEGVGRYNGLTVFVDLALPGEKIIAQITETHKTYARAKIKKIILQSPDRIEPICPLFGRCGGCQIMHLSYPKQLEAKRQRVIDALQRIGKIEVEVNPCIESLLSLNYRNKIQLPVSGYRLGLYAFNTHDLIDVKNCFINCELGNKVLDQLRALMPFPKEVKHILIRTAVKNSEVLLIFVTEKKIDLTALSKNIHGVKGILQNVNSSKNNTILGEQFYSVAGQPYIQEKICGLIFKVSPASFFQVNTLQAEEVYNKVVELCNLTGEETVIDSYCGVGTMALILAKKAKKVIGVECVKDAIIDAKENAIKNKITNAEFFCDKAETFVIKNIDVAVVNPPRKGCERPFIEKLLSLKPKRIVYMSCDPATLARDLNLLSSTYKLDIVQPFDMFPQTAHVETVVKLSIL